MMLAKAAIISSTNRICFLQSLQQHSLAPTSSLQSVAMSSSSAADAAIAADDRRVIPIDVVSDTWV